MKQILQHLKSGELELADLPAPAPQHGMVLIQTTRSLISAGTERMLVEFSQKNLLQKARSQPERLSQVLDKVRTDGFIPTLQAVSRKLDQPLPLGYCNAGRVLAVGPGVNDLKPGDRVISNGSHAEIVSVPRNLVAKIPDDVSDDFAAFAVLGSIALQGIRLAQPTFGEKFMVFGTGLLGLLAVQLLRAQGCSVLAVDLKPDRLALAAQFGASIVDLNAQSDPVAAAQAWTNGTGVDGVLITAAAESDQIIHQAAEASRKRGRIILIGSVGLNLRRDDFYKKELTFQVSCSYGPGRYDDSYEQKGHDYPSPYVRWTEQRNFQAVLDAISSGTLNVAPLITHRFPLSDALAAYDKIQNDPNALGVLLEYPATADTSQNIIVNQPRRISTERTTQTQAVIGVIGAGNFAVSTILPAIAKTGARLKYIADNQNVAALTHAARKFKAEQAVTDTRIILDDQQVNTVFIVTTHNTHAQLVCDSLDAGKNVFVEKPLCLTAPQLQEIQQLYEDLPAENRPLLMVGFNRRFSPHIIKIKQLLHSRCEPLMMTMTVNAGPIPPDHWTQDHELGGGRIIGEACHFIDLLSHLAVSPVANISAMMIGQGPAVREDKMSILLGFADGSVGTVHYFANGSRSYPKETLEIFSDRRILRMENFRTTRGYGFLLFKQFKTWRQDKGHAAEITQFINCVEYGGQPLITFDEISNVTLATLMAVESAKTGKLVRI